MEEIRSILEKRETIGARIKFYLTSAWYFETPFEKLVLISLGLLAMWKIAGWVL